jgi:hypothetical protein
MGEGERKSVSKVDRGILVANIVFGLVVIAMVATPMAVPMLRSVAQSHRIDRYRLAWPEQALFDRLDPRPNGYCTCGGCPGWPDGWRGGGNTVDDCMSNSS